MSNDVNVNKKLLKKYFDPLILDKDVINIAYFVALVIIFVPIYFILSIFIKLNDGLVLYAVFSTLIILLLLMLKIDDYLRNVPNEEEIDKLQAQMAEDIKNFSYEKLGIDSSDTIREPIIIQRPMLDSLLILGKDNLVRPSQINYIVLQFTKKYLAIYNCVYNFSCGINKLNYTEEFYYQDVTSIKTAVNDYFEFYSEFKNIKLFDINASYFGKKGKLKYISSSIIGNIDTLKIQSQGSNSLSIPVTLTGLDLNMQLKEPDINNIFKTVKTSVHSKKD